MKNKFLKNSGIVMLGLATALSIYSSKPSKVYATSQDTLTPEISYRAHVEDIGWQNFVGTNSIAGTTGQCKGMEALEINLKDAGNAIIRYRAHVSDIGWMDMVEADDREGTRKIGTTGLAKSMEAIEISVEGLEGYQIEYRAHVADIGWQEWVKQGQMAGTTGLAKRIEAFQIRLVKKEIDEEGILTYKPHVADIGWKTFKVAGGEEELQVRAPSVDKIAGTVGQNKGLEALEINFDAPEGASLKYRAHVSDIGWQDFVTADNNKNTKFIGTTGQNKSIEAIQIAVEGLKDYEIRYRAHVSNIGWMDWATASTSTELTQGNFVGTTGKVLQMEAIEIVIVPHEHTWSEWYVTKKATCMEAGEQTKTCKICLESETQILAALGHDFDEEYTIDRPATCLQDGLKSQHCSRCDRTQNSKRIPKISEHVWTVIREAKEATCTEQGNTEEKKCTICGATQRSIFTPALGHDFAEITYENVTCTTCTEVKKCTKCNEEVRENKIFGRGHDFGEGDQCKHEGCKEKKTSSEGYIYHINFFTDTNKSEPLSMDYYASRSDNGGTIEAPEAKKGYKFDGWYNKVTKELISNEQTLEYSSKYADMAIEACYEPITD